MRTNPRILCPEYAGWLPNADRRKIHWPVMPQAMPALQGQRSAFPALSAVAGVLKKTDAPHAYYPPTSLACNPDDYGTRCAPIPFWGYGGAAADLYRKGATYHHGCGGSPLDWRQTDRLLDLLPGVLGFRCRTADKRYSFLLFHHQPAPAMNPLGTLCFYVSEDEEALYQPPSFLPDCSMLDPALPATGGYAGLPAQVHLSGRPNRHSIHAIKLLSRDAGKPRTTYAKRPFIQYLQAPGHSWQIPQQANADYAPPLITRAYH